MWSEEKSKIARRCGEKHILKWKCKKHHMLGALFEVLMSKKCTRLWREAHFEVKMYKTRQQRTVFWSSDVEKLHEPVAKSAFWSQNAKKLRVREHFLKFWCRKIARRCGEKHVIKSKCTKHVSFGALFEVLMSKIARRCGEKHIMKSKCTKHVSSGQFFEVLMPKNCMNLWREVHLSVKMYKIPVFWRAFSSSDVKQLVR